MPYQLTKRVGIVCVRGHDFAVRVRIEKLHGKRFHFIEHIAADVIQRALRYHRHDAVVGKRGKQREKITRAHDDDERAESARNAFVAVRDAGIHDVVDVFLHEQRRNQSAARAYDKA